MDILSRYLSNISDGHTAKVLRPLFEGLCDKLSSRLLVSAALAIKSAGSPTVKSNAVFYATADGKIVTKPASTDMAALAGTVTNAKFNVFCFFIDSSGTLTTSMGTEGASLAAVKFPNFPQKLTLIGFIIVNPTGTGNFVGGTTALDDVTVVPNVVYVNTIGPFDPSALI